MPGAIGFSGGDYKRLEPIKREKINSNVMHLRVENKRGLVTGGVDPAWWDVEEEFVVEDCLEGRYHLRDV